MMMRRELERIYEAHAPSVFALFHQFTRNETDARDLLQDWLVKIGRGLDRLPKVDNERAYLLKMQPPFPRPPIRPDGCLRGLPPKANY